MKITVVGSGYVGSSMSSLLAQNNEVVLLDVSEEKVNKVNAGISPIEDPKISEFLESGKLNLKATTDKAEAYDGAQYVIVAVPTDYNPETRYFNTSLVERVILDANKHNPDCTIVIKSTIPVGFVLSTREKLGIDNLIFSPEFLREGSALQDNLYPDRIVVGEKSERARIFADLLQEGAEKTDIEVLFTDPTEAEAVKLFANSYLAMRVAYFNELDSYAELHGLNTGDIIRGASLDHRIGTHYNNPSFGYGGYCFPKDTKQLMANFEGTPSHMIQAVVASNETRKQFITDQILSKDPETIGIFRLTMKAGSDNFRSSAIQDIINKLIEQGKNVIIYEPTFKDTNFDGIPVVNNTAEFCEMSDIIVANRVEPEIQFCADKVYTRDIFNSDS
jgi:UDPglucose 6-dehydrogenase